LISSTNSTLPAAQWNEETTGTIDGSGSFSVTNNPGNSLLPQFYRLRIP
jgi:hypothetical protein